MSFIILILIIIMLYASLTRYGNIAKVMLITVLISGMTVAFLIYGIHIFGRGNSFVILNTEMNRTVFIHACLVWFAADLLVFFKILKNYRRYKEVNSKISR